MASTPIHVLAPSGLTLTLFLYPEGSDTVANGAGNALTEQTNRKGVYVATVTQALTGRHYAIVKDGSSNLIANGALELVDSTAVHLVDDLGLTTISSVVAEITAKASETQTVVIDGDASILSAIGSIDTAVGLVKAKTDQLQFTANLLQVVLHDATAAGLAKFASVDTLEVSAASGSVAALSQGAGGGGGGSATIEKQNEILALLSTFEVTRLGPGWDAATQTLTLVQGDDYRANKGRAISFSLVGIPFSLVGATARVRATHQYYEPIEGTATILDPSGTPSLQLEWTRAQLNKRPGEYRWDAEIIDSDGDVATSFSGILNLVESRTEVAP